MFNLTHNRGYIHRVKPSNFKEYHDFVSPLFDIQLEMITNLKKKQSSYINQIEIHQSSDFVSMLNYTRLLLKDFVKKEDMDKLQITHYKLKNQEEPQEELKQQNVFQDLGIGLILQSFTNCVIIKDQLYLLPQVSMEKHLVAIQASLGPKIISIKKIIRPFYSNQTKDQFIKQKKIRIKQLVITKFSGKIWSQQ
eukprot:403363733